MIQLKHNNENNKHPLEKDYLIFNFYQIFNIIKILYTNFIHYI